MSLLSSDAFEFMNSDSICLEEGDIVNREDVYSDEFLNTIRASGIPNHLIRLKVGCSIILLRIYQSVEQSNNTRLIMTTIEKQVIEAKMIVGKNFRSQVLIRQMVLTPSDVIKFPVMF